jgi:hypothetical protein
LSGLLLLGMTYGINQKTHLRVYETNDMHQKPRKAIPIEHDNEDLLHCVNFCIIVSLLQDCSESLKVGSMIEAVFVMDDGPSRWR